MSGSQLIADGEEEGGERNDREGKEEDKWEGKRGRQKRMEEGRWKIRGKKVEEEERKRKMGEG